MYLNFIFRYYCQQTGLIHPEDLCLAGYYCNGSAAVPNQHLCTIGHYCPTGSERPTPCPRGYFSKVEGNANFAFFTVIRDYFCILIRESAVSFQNGLAYDTLFYVIFDYSVLRKKSPVKIV